jgi:general secretion pathway protein F
MPNFKYRAFSGAGDLQEGEIEARSSEDAEETLVRRGLTPFETQEIGGAGKSLLQGLFRPRGPSAAQIASFTREFATLEQADVPLDQSLRILSTQNSNPAIRGLAQNLLHHIIDGASLSDALTRQEGLFAADYVNVVRAGEAMGNVGMALTELADMLERRIEVRARVQSSLIYPVLLIVLALASTAIVLGTLVPNIAPIFTDNGKPMPSGLQFIIDIESNWAIFAGLFVALGVGGYAFFRYASTRPEMLVAIDKSLLRLPFVGPWRAHYETARFARTLGSLLRAGVPLLQGLESARSVVSDHYMGGQIEVVIEAVRGGATLSAALGRVDGVPVVAVQMISIGEEVGKLEGMLLRVADMFERETQRSVERVIGLLTPVLTILIAAVVGGLIMTVMDAVLGINELATK